MGQEAPASVTTQGLATQWGGVQGRKPLDFQGAARPRPANHGGGGVMRGVVFALGRCGAGVQKGKNSKNLIGEVLGDSHTLLNSTDRETEIQRK